MGVSLPFKWRLPLSYVADPPPHFPKPYGLLVCLYIYVCVYVCVFFRMQQGGKGHMHVLLMTRSGGEEGGGSRVVVGLHYPSLFLSLLLSPSYHF